MNEKLFFELIRVSFGYSNSLSYTPNANEWELLYKLAKKHCLLGICFVGIKRLDHQRTAIQRRLYLKWMASVVEIQDDNKKIQEECKEVYKKIASDGYDNCILKGIGLASNYGDLARFRHCGDIDVLLSSSVEDALSYALKLEGKNAQWSYKHAHINTLCKTEVDLHYRPVMSRNLIRNKKLQGWCEEIKKAGFKYREDLGFATLKDVDNIVFVLYHILWHFLFEGVGLRQVMDFYFLILHAETSLTLEEQDKVRCLIKDFSMRKFASALAWVLWYVFEDRKPESIFCSKNSILPSPDEKQGLFLLSEIVSSGNMGHGDTRNIVLSTDSPFVRFVKKTKHYGRLCYNYPTEFLWIPVGSIYVRNWKKKMKREIFTNN